MDVLISIVLLLLTMGAFLIALFYVVRTAVKEGMQLALKADLLDQRALGNTDTTDSSVAWTDADGLWWPSALSATSAMRTTPISGRGDLRASRAGAADDTHRCWS